MVKLNASTKQQGLTLLGVLIATLLFAVVLLATTRLLASTTHNVGVSREEFIAVNLAREGLELLQAVRDSNWFSGSASWVGHPAQATGAAAGICDGSLEINRRFTIEADGHGPSGIFINPGGAPQLYRGGNGFTHRPSTRPEDRTLFSREIEVDCSQHTSDPAVITVTSKVSWSSRNQNHKVDVKTKLYNWYAP